jgi:hypothetical protein
MDLFWNDPFSLIRQRVLSRNNFEIIKNTRFRFYILEEPKFLSNSFWLDIGQQLSVGIAPTYKHFKTP